MTSTTNPAPHKLRQASDIQLPYSHDLFTEHNDHLNQTANCKHYGDFNNSTNAQLLITTFKTLHQFPLGTPPPHTILHRHPRLAFHLPHLTTPPDDLPRPPTPQRPSPPRLHPPLALPTISSLPCGAYGPSDIHHAHHACGSEPWEELDFHKVE